MAQTQSFEIGRNTTWVQAIPQQIAPDGTLSNAGAVTADGTALIRTTLTSPQFVAGVVTVLVPQQGVVDDVTISGRTSSENIAAMTRPRQNNVPLAYGQTVNMTEILRFGNGKSLLGRIYNTSFSKYSRFRMINAQGFWDFYGVVISYNERLEKGKSVARMSLGPIDCGIDSGYLFTAIDQPADALTGSPNT